MKKTILALLTLLVFNNLQAQPPYNEAIALLRENKQSEAADALRQLQNSPKDKSAASLALTLIELDQERYEHAFKDFMIFFKNQPNPYPYVYALSNSGLFGKNDNDDVEAFMKQILEDPNANNTIKATAIDNLGNHLVAKNEFDAARDMYKNLGEVKNWSTVGDFENLSGSGFNKDFGVLKHPEADYNFTNKTGATVHWFDINEVRNDRWYDMNIYHNTSNSIIYSQTYIHSDADKEVWLMVGVSGSLKVWLNDFEVISESEERNTDEDVYTCKVKLQKGVNRLLVQTGSSEIDRNNFMVRMTDVNGALITDVNSTPHYEPYTKATTYEVSTRPLFAEKYFEDELAKDTSDFIDKILLLDVYNHNEKKYAAHKIVDALKKAAPNSTMISEKFIETANIDDNKVAVSKEKETIKTKDPESLEGLKLRYSDAFSKDNMDEAMKLLNRRIELFGATAVTENDLVSIYSKKKELEKFYNEIDAGYEKFPTDAKLVELKYIVAQSKDKDVKESKLILKNYLKHNFNETLYELMIANELRSGDKKEAIKLCEEGIEKSPAGTGWYLKIAQLHFAMRQYDEALEWVSKAMKICPYSGTLYYTAGLMYEGKDDKAKAKEMMRKCVYYSPVSYEAREKLRTLENKKKLTDYFKHNEIEKIYKDALVNDKYAKEEAVALLEDTREIVYPEQGATEEQVEILVYINSQTAINRFKEYYISHNPYAQKLIIEKAELLKKDGNKVPAEKKNAYVVFSSIGIGDAIHLNYKLENSFQGKLAEHFWNQMNFNSTYPTETSRFSLIIPKDMRFDYKVSNKDLKPTDSAFDEYVRYIWEEKDLPKIVTEAQMDRKAYEKLTLTSIPDWNYVANWYSDVSYIKTKADFEVREKVKELMAGNENKSQFEKARIIYDYIEDNYNYSNVSFLHSAFTPQRASRTMSTKLGDCKDLSTLFVSMTREAGLDANLVLVRTKGSGDDDLELPCIAFNHCIAQLHADDKNYLVELTNNHLPFTAVGPSLFTANGLYIPKDGGSTTQATLVKLNTPDKPVNGSDRQTELNFDGDRAIIHRMVYKTGTEAANVRHNLKDLDADEQQKKLTTSVNEELNKNIKLENLKIENLKNLSDTVAMSYDIVIDHFTNSVAGLQIFRLPWTDAHSGEKTFSLDQRKYNLDMTSFVNIPVRSESITINIPKGKKLAEVPKDVNLSCDAISYSLTFKIKDEIVIATREMKYLKENISPADYESTKNMISKINNADEMDLALK